MASPVSGNSVTPDAAIDARSLRIFFRFRDDRLARKASSRLGYTGNSEVKTHHWFKDFEWEAL